MSQFIANSFQVPNALIDELLCKISGNACKVYLLIVRKTRGWNKQSDRISFSQIRELTGIGSNTTIDKAIDELLQLKLIKVSSGNQKISNKYSLNDDVCFTETVTQQPITKTVKAVTKNVKAITETVTQPFTETVNTENKYKTTNNKNTRYKTSEAHALENSFENENQTKKTKSVLTASDLLKLKLSDFEFTDKDYRENPNLQDWLFDELTYQVAKDFVSSRKSKLTMTAMKTIVKESALANINLNTSLEFCIVAGWQTFKAEWYFNRISSNQANSQPKQAKTNFFDELAELDRQERQARGLA